VNNVEEGTTVNLNIGGTDCDGATISFEVLEYDATSSDDPVTTNPSNVVFSGSATGTWTAEYQDDGLIGGDPEYYFIASVVGDTEQIQSGTADVELLHVSEATGGTICGDGVCNGTETNVTCPADCDITPPTYFGDLNHDGRITISDIMIIMRHILNREINWESDVDSDGEVNIFDLVKVARIWGKQYETDTTAPTVVHSMPSQTTLPLGTTHCL
jgi:hypothetical protein